MSPCFLSKRILGIRVLQLTEEKICVKALWKISLCSDLGNGKSLQLFVCCQWEWVVSGWGRQRAKCLNTGLCCSDDGCIGKNTVKWWQWESPTTTSHPPTPTLSYPIMESAFEDSEATGWRQNRENRETGEQKREGAKEWSGMSCQWSGLVVHQLRASDETQGRRRREGRGVVEEVGRVEKRKKRREGRNQYFHDVATQATANDSKHHENIWEQGRGKKWKR